MGKRFVRGSGDGSPPEGSRGGVPVEGLGDEFIKSHDNFDVFDNEKV